MSIIKKSLAVAVILLFIGVAVTPSINFNVVKAASENDLIEVTSEACGMKGFGNQTVKLTKQQYQNLEQYLVEFRARLNQTSTREEAVPIFKEAVVELNKYGLLPKGMSVEQTQNLVIQQTQNEYVIKFQKRFINYRILLNDDENYFSLIAGVTTRTLILGPFPTTCILTGAFGVSLMDNLPVFVRLIGVFILFLSLVVGLFSLLFYFFPISSYSVITIGAEVPSLMPYIPPHYYPSYGWICSLGPTGSKMWVGSFYGDISWNIVCTGVVGFTGIKIALLTDCFYLGSAIKIGIDHNPPPR